MGGPISSKVLELIANHVGYESRKRGIYRVPPEETFLWIKMIALGVAITSD